MSGGRATISRGEVQQCGDICSVAAEGHVLTDKYLFECKHYRNLKLESFVVTNKGPLAKFWYDTVKAAKRHNREPVLIAKSNHVPVLVLTLNKSRFNRHPIARIRNCNLGLLDWILKEKFDGA